VREGFIVGSDEDDEEDDAATIAARRLEKRKRRREEREQEQLLDDDDFDLIGVDKPRSPTEVGGVSFAVPRTSCEHELTLMCVQHVLKRIKRGHQNRQNQLEISDDEGEGDGRDRDELGDFIEDDIFSDDDEEGTRRRDDLEVGRSKKPFTIAGLTSGLDERALEDYHTIFGNGAEYEWALSLEEQEQELMDEEKPLELKDVFEPAQVAAKLQTDDDNIIRMTDIPERLQLAWKQVASTQRSPEEEDQILQEEAQWIASLVLPKRRLDSYLIQPFENAVLQSLKFLNKDHFEVPFIYQHRRDFLIHDSRPNGDTGTVSAERLLVQNDLWELFELDLRFKSILEKRDGLQKAYRGLQEYASVHDNIIDDLLPKAVTAEDVQDLHDYLHFRYSAELKDVQAMTATANGAPKRRPRAAKDTWEQIRGSKVYNFVRAVGLTTDDFARNTLGVDARVFTEDATEGPEALADSLLDPPRHTSSVQIVNAAKLMFVEELSTNPRMRQFMRKTFYEMGVIDCFRTKKGAVEITEDHRYYEFKYTRGLEFSSVARKPETFLRMLKAEEEGLLEVKFRLINNHNFRRKMYSYIEIDSYSEVGELWNTLRREWIDSSLDKLEEIISRGVKEALRSECENNLARFCREAYSEKLDRMPYKPPKFEEGETPSVLALSNGHGVHNRDAVVWIFMDENGKVVENGKFNDIRASKEETKMIPPGADNNKLLDLITRRVPDVIGVSGFSPETKKLHKELQDILDAHEKEEAELRERNKRPGDSDDEGAGFHKPEVVMVNDEVARIYHNTDRAVAQHPNLPPLGRYCVALARYLQSPLLEYASLGADISSIKFDPNQDLIPADKLARYLETAMVDIVNLVGVDIEEAIASPYKAVLLQYVCGLGPRKVSRLLETINHDGGIVESRTKLLGDQEEKISQALGPVVWANCASFIYLLYQESEPTSDPLDQTRIHPEDYQIALKIAADALNLDEEDIQYEGRVGAQSAVVRKLHAEHQEDQLHELQLDSYADNLEIQLGQKKRATLELIRAELANPYEEMRHNFGVLSPEDIFTMLTGETKESLADGMIVPVKIRKILREHIEVRLDCGLEGVINLTDYGNAVTEGGQHAKDVYSVGQTLPAKLLFLNRRSMSAQLSFREDMLRRAYAKPSSDRLLGEWDSAQEAEDQKIARQEKESKSGRPHRVVKHPLFRPFNSMQAEEYLGSRPPGDLVIRPSSRGLDHLAITWKVADLVFQHIDVLELDKENEYAVGRTLKIGGKYTYSDLDDLIVNHIESMARKVVEMTNDNYYQSGSRNETGKPTLLLLLLWWWWWWWW
jgi:transcription elongation factor SPT6